ncbi:MAG: PaaI family thioesterase [Gammaproteobacteria bacterium]
MHTEPRDADWLNRNLTRGAFHRWLGLTVTRTDHEQGSVEIHVPWREEFVGSPQPAWAHGGILAALVDVGGFFCVAAATGRLSVTIDLRTDFHRAATPGDLLVRARIVKAGGTIITSDVQILDTGLELVASGRTVTTVKR